MKVTAYLAVIFVGVALQASAEPLVGRAIIAALRGDVSYTGHGDEAALKEGMALTPGYRIDAKKGALCATLTPGALLCVHEDTRLDIKQLEHRSEGLPGAGRNSTEREIVLNLERGAIMIHAGEAAADRSIEVDFGKGLKVLSTGGDYIVASFRTTKRVFVEKGVVTVENNGKSSELTEGHLMKFVSGGAAGNEWKVSAVKRKDSGLPYDFDVCRKFFKPLESYAFDWDWGNIGGLNEWIEAPEGIIFVGNPSNWDDVSPSVHQGRMSRSQSVVVSPAASAGGGKWRRPDIWSWYKNQATLRGVNYLPRTAVNSIEMWQESTFDPKTIDQELGWAEDIKLSSLRVFLPYAVWKDDAKGLKKRMHKFLDLADDHDLSTVFVLFDDKQAAGMEPKVGPQPDPVPGVYNSRWVASPGHGLVAKSSGSWPDLKQYVQDIVGEFDDDSRVLMWDVYNEAGQSDMGSKSIPLLKSAFKWIRDISPDQPITAGIGRFNSQDDRSMIMGQSDVVTLVDYESADQMMGLLSLASLEGRPVVCTGWLDRQHSNTFKDILPVFSRFGVGWYNWGLVRGRTQLYLSRDLSKVTSEDSVWGQDILDDKGVPFDEDEIKLIKGFSFDEL